MRHIVPAVAGLIGLAAAAPGQTKVRTDCTRYVDGAMTCVTKEDPSSPLVRYLEERRARANQLVQENALNTANLADRIAEERALVAIFVPKARYAIRVAVDSLGFADATAAAFRHEAWDVVSNVFVANGSASSSEIADALVPLIASYRQRGQAFDASANRIVLLLLDSLALPKAAATRFIDDVMPEFTRLRQRNLDASEAEIRQSINFAVARIDIFRRTEQSIRRRAKKTN
jgi:hypothetical protein